MGGLQQCGLINVRLSVRVLSGTGQAAKLRAPKMRLGSSLTSTAAKMGFPILCLLKRKTEATFRVSRGTGFSTAYWACVLPLSKIAHLVHSHPSQSSSSVLVESTACVACLSCWAAHNGRHFRAHAGHVSAAGRIGCGWQL